MHGVAQLGTYLAEYQTQFEENKANKTPGFDEAKTKQEIFVKFSENINHQD